MYSETEKNLKKSTCVVMRKKIEKKHLCRHDKNYYYFWKSNIPVFNLILDFRNMLKIPKV